MSTHEEDNQKGLSLASGDNNTKASRTHGQARAGMGVTPELTKVDVALVGTKSHCVVGL